MKSKKVLLSAVLLSISMAHAAQHEQQYFQQGQQPSGDQVSAGYYFSGSYGPYQLPVFYYIPESLAIAPATASCPVTSKDAARTTQLNVNCCSEINCDCSGDDSACNEMFTNICGAITRVAGDLQKNTHEWVVEKYHQIVGQHAQARSEKSPKAQ